MAALAQWKSLRAALQKEKSASFEDKSMGGGGDTLQRERQGRQGGGWSGPDVLSRIAAAEWRLAKENERLLAAAAAETAAADAAVAAAAQRSAWISSQKESLKAWQESGGAAARDARTLSLSGTQNRPHSSPSSSFFDEEAAARLAARSAAAIAAAAAKRAALDAAKAAKAAETSERAGERRAREAMARIGSKRGVFSGRIFTESGKDSNDVVSPLPERPTNASTAHAISSREVQQAQALRAFARAHETALPSVKPLARGKAFGIGAFGALPSRATPTWRKKLGV